MTSDKTKLGDRCKQFEMAENSKTALTGLPLIARLDGRAFHTFTREMDRPFDARFSHCMRATAHDLADEFGALIGYTQSDEISLMWWVSADSTSQYPFNGRFQKLTSCLASYAAVSFYREIAKSMPEYADSMPHFDCRVWQVPTQSDAVDVFMWRQMDAKRNSIQMLAQSHFSHRQLHRKSTSDLLKMLQEKGVMWSAYSGHCRFGSFVYREVIQHRLTDEEYNKIPVRRRPDREQLVTRHFWREFDWPLTVIGNRTEFLFERAAPVPLQVPHELFNEHLNAVPSSS